MSPIEDLHQGREPNPKALLLGHVRLGTFSVNHPQQSEGFVFTSSDPLRLQPLAEDFGGEVEQYTPQGAGEETWRVISRADAITALFPWPDIEGNFAQDWTLWRRAGLQRRCTGYACTTRTVDEVSGEVTEEEVDCICRAKGTRECSPETRLRLLLPQTGLGIWEVVTHSKWAALYLHDQIAFMAGAAPGRMNHLPIRLVYVPREIHYVDEKGRHSTTKRIVSISIAGDAAHALRAMSLEPNQALIAAVASALADSGRELVGIRANLALPERAGDEQPASDTSLPDAGEAAPGEAPPSPPHPEKAPRPDAPEDASEPASEALWNEALACGLSGRKALLRLNKNRPADQRIPDASAITDGQLRELIERARS